MGQQNVSNAELTIIKLTIEEVEIGLNSGTKTKESVMSRFLKSFSRQQQSFLCGTQ